MKILPVYTTFLALSLAFLLFEVFALAYGQAPAILLSALWEGTFGTAYGTGQVLFKMTPLIFTGLSVGIAFRAGLFNIGAEGQAVLGALAMGLVGAYLPASLPAVVVIPLCLAAGGVAGGIWGGAAGILKARFGAHEVITTIMFNFIAMAVSGWMVLGHLAIPETLHTREIVENAKLSRIETYIAPVQGSAVNTALLLALVSAVICYFLVFKSRWGYDIRAFGTSPEAAAFGGILAPRVIVEAMIISGMLAGLAGANFVLGYKYYHEEGFSGGIGFLGIAVALLGQSHPIGIVGAALLFGFLAQGGLAINAMLPKDTMEILQAVIIITVATMSSYFRQPYLKGG